MAFEYPHESPLLLVKPGTYPLPDGRSVTFDEADLRRMLAAYFGPDRQPVRPAPITIGHPEDDQPRHGVIQLLVYDRGLYGYAGEVSDGFRRGYREGLYEHYGPQFYAPSHPRNPVPGSWYLKHVGFGGPAPPTLQGTLTLDYAGRPDAAKDFAAASHALSPTAIYEARRRAATGGAAFGETRGRLDPTAIYARRRAQASGAEFREAPAMMTAVQGAGSPGLRDGLSRIEIFRTGTHTTAAGQTLSFGAEDLRATAAAYSPQVHEAPLVVGHPAHDAPAYGWVRSLAYADGVLRAEVSQVDPAFAELVRSGRYRKVSPSFYLPGGASNPSPGVYYLRHVGFLGAAAPAVKGLRPAQFSRAERGMVLFEDVPAGDGPTLSVERIYAARRRPPC